MLAHLIRGVSGLEEHEQAIGTVAGEETVEPSQILVVAHERLKQTEVVPAGGDG